MAVGTLLAAVFFFFFYRLQKVRLEAQFEREYGDKKDIRMLKKGKMNK